MYHVLRKDRLSWGGGVAAFVNRQLHIVEIPIATEFSDLELLCFDVVFKTHKVRFFNVYSPPRKDRPTASSVYTDILVKCFSSHLAKHHCNVVVGDFNCPQINWNAPLCFANEYACKAVINWIASLSPLVLLSLSPFPHGKLIHSISFCVIRISLFVMCLLVHLLVTVTTVSLTSRF